MTLKMTTAPPPPPDPNPHPTTTKAWTFTARGAPSEILTLTPDHPLPPFPPPPTSKDFAEEVLLIRVSHASLNPGSIFHLRLLPAAARASPSVPGCDFSGTVVAVHAPPSPSQDSAAADTSAPTTTEAQSPRFKSGARVVGFVPVSHGFPTGTGTLAEYIVIPARFAVALPDNVSLADAGGVMVCALTGLMAVDAAVKEGGLAQGRRVLVIAAAGGIGSMVVQMVRDIVHGTGSDGAAEPQDSAEGAEGTTKKGLVAAIVSTRNIPLATSLGADEVIDYTTYPGASLAAELSRRYGSEDTRFDAVVDCCGVQSLYTSSHLFTADGSPWASVGVKLSSWSYGVMLPTVWKMQMNAWWPVTRWLGGTGRLWRGVTMMSASVETMERVVGMMERGRLRIVREGVWAMEDLKEAYEKLEAGGTRGKIIVRVGEGDEE